MPNRPIINFLDRPLPLTFVPNFGHYSWTRSNLAEALVAALPGTHVTDLADYFGDACDAAPKRWLEDMPAGMWGKKLSLKQLKKYRANLPQRLDKQLLLMVSAFLCISERGGNVNAFRDTYRIYPAIYGVTGFTPSHWRDITDKAEVMTETGQPHNHKNPISQIARGVTVTYPTAFRLRRALLRRNINVGAVYALDDRPGNGVRKAPCLTERLIPLRPEDREGD